MNRTPNTSWDLVARAKNGNTGAFSELVRRYRPKVFALALQLAGQESDADDVTQDVFLRAYRALHRFEGRSQFFTWIYRMGVNLALNARRDRRRRAEVPLDDPRIERALFVDAPNDPVRASELRQTYAQLLSALDRLPASMRTSVVLVALQGLSYQEAVAVQGCAEGTIAWNMHQARRRLRLALTQPVAVVRPPRQYSALSAGLAALLREWGVPLPY